MASSGDGGGARESRFHRALERAAIDVRRMFDELLPRPANAEAQLLEAMRYAATSGGKRLRPFLLLETARLFDVPENYALRAAAALECVHIYSLVYDDLPCMDDGSLRHGKPATHVKFGEATAVLAGGALLSLAFEILADRRTHPDSVIRSTLIGRLAKAAGSRGMLGGQMIDLTAHSVSRESVQREGVRRGGLTAANTDAPPPAARDLATVARLQRLKTGELIAFACEAGAILGQASAQSRHLLHAYAHDVGLAFQITDDLLDRRGDSARLGKDVGKDEAADKLSFVSVLGVEKAETQAHILVDQAIRHLDGFGPGAEPLRMVARFVVNRQF